MVVKLLGSRGSVPWNYYSGIMKILHVLELRKNGDPFSDVPRMGAKVKSLGSRRLEWVPPIFGNYHLI